LIKYAEKVDTLKTDTTEPKKLPKTLGDEWEEILKNEYGMTIKDLFNKNGRWDELKVPEELRTDEWWKKRNL